MGDITPIATQAVEPVVEALEQALEEARAGNLRNVAIVGQRSSGNMYYTNWGLENNIFLLGHLTRIQHQIQTVIDSEGAP
jgi:hypothetical protein